VPIPEVSSSRTQERLLAGHLPPLPADRAQEWYSAFGIGHADLASEIEFVMGRYGAVYYVTGAARGTTVDTFQLALWRYNLILRERQGREIKLVQEQRFATELPCTTAATLALEWLNSLSLERRVQLSPKEERDGDFTNPDSWRLHGFRFEDEEPSVLISPAPTA